MNHSQPLIWHSPSTDSSQSMPLGGCGIGINAWFESGSLLLYFQQSGTFDEHNGFPKLGRLRISSLDNHWQTPRQFEQILDSETGSLTLTFTDEQDVKQHFKVWANIFLPVFHIEHESSEPCEIIAAYENWRFADRSSAAEDESSYIFGERNDIFAYWMYPHELIRHKDQPFASDNSIGWYHQNDNRDLAFDKEMDQQGFSAEKARLFNPQRNLIYGAQLHSLALKPYHDTHGNYLGVPFQALRMVSTKANYTHRIDVHCHCAQQPDIAHWFANLSNNIASYQATNYQEQKSRSQQWWAQFWQRSWINIEPNGSDQQVNAEVSQVSRNYRWFRYMQGFNVNGSFPTKFNGGLLTYDSVLVNYLEDQRDVSFVKEVEAEKARHADAAEIEANENLRIVRDFGPDYRAWGGGSITPQNQRLLYWPLLKSGDYDLFAPQFNWYCDTLETTELRTQIAYGHGGCSYTEQINNFGLPIGSHFGWKRPKAMGLGQQINRSCDDHYSTQLEFAFMMLEYQRYSGLSIDPYLPFIESAAEFFFAHFESVAAQDNRTAYDEDGYLIIYPSSGLESYKEAKNPNDVTCGLRHIYTALLAQVALSPEKHALYSKRLKQIPPIIHRQYNGHTTLSPAYEWAEINNVELPQMYPVYPYQEYGVGLANLQVARDTWTYSCNELYGQRSYASWHQDGIFCAHLGLVEEAVKVLVCKLADGGRRFPAFWGPGHDWTPDHNWGGTGMIQLQEMLLQDKGGKIHLLPCWPTEWDVDFRLHAGANTTVECRYERGAISKLVVSPKTREQDIVLYH